MSIYQQSKSEIVRQRLLAGEWLGPRRVQDEYRVSASFLSKVIARMRDDGYEFESRRRGDLDGQMRVHWHLAAATPTRTARHAAAVAAATGAAKPADEPDESEEFVIREDPIPPSGGSVPASEEAAAEADMPLIPLPRLGGHLRVTAMAIAGGKVQAALRSPEGSWMATLDVDEADAEELAPTFGCWLQLKAMALDGAAVRIELVRGDWIWNAVIDAVAGD